MEEGNKKERIIIIGAGPVGALAALYAALRDYEVEIYELRSDLRLPSTTPLNFTKSINLALSERGINAIRQSGCPQLLENIMKETIPMKGRMIHGKDISGALFEQSQDYDIHGRAIHAVDRGGLNKALLDELEAMPNVRFFFNHKLTGADFRNNKAWFEVHGNDSSQSSPNARDQEVEVAFDLLIGADGAHSAARYHLMKFVRMDYQQEYIDTLWCEFQIPANEIKHGNDPESRFRISPNHLHIWPGKEFMFIAIPSLDGSFTSTLFLPSSYFNELELNPSSLPSFFDTHFPGVTSIIPPSDLIFSFTTNPHLPLISIKCHPYHFSSSGVILGDAAHAMVPFYGQGMNSGLEDVRVLFSILDKHALTTSPTSSSSTAATPVMHAPNPTTTSTTKPSPKHLRALALTEYSAIRQPDAYTINDLALQNYTEMRSSVVSPMYKLRKWAEEKMSIWFPSSGWQTKYSRVSFGNQRYSEVVKNSESQGRVLVGGLIGLAMSPLVVTGLIGWYRWRNGLRRLWG